MKTRLTPLILQPQGRARDIYTNVNGGASLAKLADGLKQFAPSLARFGSTLQEGEDQDAQIAGSNAAREFVEQGKTYKQAVDAGLIKPHQSPFFRLGAYETFGRASAHRYSADFEAALAQSPVAESTNPADFNAFEGDFRSKWQQEHLGEKIDPYFQNAFGKQADALIEGSRHNFAEQAGARLVKQTGEAFHAEAFALLQEGRNKKLTPEQMAAQLDQAAKRQNAAGLSYAVINPLLSSAIDAAALDAEDASLLAVKDHIRLGAGTLAGTTYGSKGTVDTKGDIASIVQRRLAAEHQDAERKKDAAVDGVMGSFVTALEGAESPFLVDEKPYVEQLVKAGAPDKVTTLLGMKKAIADREYEDNPAVEQRLTIGVYGGSAGMGQLNDALASKSITFNTYRTLANEVEEQQKAGTRKGDTRFRQDMEKVRTRARSLYVSEYGGSTQEERLRAENASSAAVREWIAWKQTDEGKNATTDQTEEWVHGEVMRQFGLNAKESKVNRAESKHLLSPDVAPARPEPVDYKKLPAAPPETIRMIQQDFEKGTFSAATVRALRQMNVPLTPAAVEEFLKAQQQHLKP